MTRKIEDMAPVFERGDKDASVSDWSPDRATGTVARLVVSRLVIAGWRPPQPKEDKTDE